MKQTLLCLALQRVNAVTEVELQDGLDVYHCSWPQGYHYIQITLELASKLKWKSTDIYISLKPAYRKEQIGPYENIARLQAGSPERPYQLTASIMKRWEEELGLTLSDARIPPLPWTGSHAIILLFKLDHPRYQRLHKWVTVEFGICIAPGSPGSQPRSDIRDDVTDSCGISQSQRSAGKHYAVIQYYLMDEPPQLQSLVTRHSCEHDHLDTTQIYDYPEWTERPIRRQFDDVLFVRFRPGRPLDTTGLATVLEVDIANVRIGELCCVKLLFITELGITARERRRGELTRTVARFIEGSN